MKSLFTQHFMIDEFIGMGWGLAEIHQWLVAMMVEWKQLRKIFLPLLPTCV